MRILGIDPGSRKVGFGVLEVSRLERRFTHIAHGILRLNTEQDLSLRMKELAHRLQEILHEIKPECVVLEDVFMGENARSALILGQARGAVLAIVGLSNIPVFNLSTTTVKLAVAGTGRASKNQVGEMVRVILNLSKKPAEDASDALALAICHGHQILSPYQSGAIAKPKKMNKKQKNQALADLAKTRQKVW